MEQGTLFLRQMFFVVSNRVWAEGVRADPGRSLESSRWLAVYDHMRVFWARCRPDEWTIAKLDRYDLPRPGADDDPVLIAVSPALRDPARAALASCGQRVVIQQRLGYLSGVPAMSFDALGVHWGVDAARIERVYRKGMAALGLEGIA